LRRISMLERKTMHRLPLTEYFKTDKTFCIFTLVMFLLVVAIYMPHLCGCSSTILKPVVVELDYPVLRTYGQKYEKPEVFTINLGDTIDRAMIEELKAQRTWSKDLERRVRLYEHQINLYNETYGQANEAIKGQLPLDKSRGLNGDIQRKS
jgi:hypothetical protein